MQHWQVSGSASGPWLRESWTTSTHNRACEEPLLQPPWQVQSLAHRSSPHSGGPGQITGQFSKSCHPDSDGN